MKILILVLTLFDCHKCFTAIQLQ